MHGEYKVPGGKLVVVDLAVVEGRLDAVRVSGDFFLQPDTALDAIDAALQGLDAASSEAKLAAAVQRVLDAGAVLHGASAEAVAIAVRRALEGGAP